MGKSSAMLWMCMHLALVCELTSNTNVELFIVIVFYYVAVFSAVNIHISEFLINAAY